MPGAARPAVLLDTNVLFLAARTGFPIEREVLDRVDGARLVVPTSVLEELDRLVARRTPLAELARGVARRFPVLRAPGTGDDAILAAAVRERALVVTADRVLAERLRIRGITVLVPRDRVRLERRAGHRVPATPFGGNR